MPVSKLLEAHRRQIRGLEDDATQALFDAYARTEADLTAQLERLDAAGQSQSFTAQHLGLIRAQVRDGLELMAQGAGDDLNAQQREAMETGMRQGIAEIAELEARFNPPTETLAARIEAIPPVIPAQQVALLAQPSNLLVVRSAEIAESISRELAQVAARGEGIGKAVSRLQSVMSEERYKLERIARTEINEAANFGHLQAIDAVASEFPEMELQKQWSSFEDSRTSARCRSLDGQVRPVDEVFVAPIDGWTGMAPTAHPQCRSRVQAYRSAWSSDGKQPRSDEQVRADEEARQARRQQEREERRRARQASRRAGKALSSCQGSTDASDREQATPRSSRAGRVRHHQMSKRNGRPSEIKAFEFKLLNLTEEGEFEGYLSVFGNVDQGGDLVEKGAFARTIAHKARSGKYFPLLWQHDQKEPIGIIKEAREDDTGLYIKGQLNLETNAHGVYLVPLAAKGYALMKQGAIEGLSMGYDAIQKAHKGQVRHLKEVKLYEGSLVTFPMNEAATVTGVKAANFATILANDEAERNMYEARWKLDSALSSSIRGALSDDEMDTDARLNLIDESLAQYHEAMYKWAVGALAANLYSEKGEAGPDEQKAGRKLSAATRAQIEGTVKTLMALLEDGVMPGDSEKDTAGTKTAPGPADTKTASEGGTPDPANPGHSEDDYADALANFALAQVAA